MGRVWLIDLDNTLHDATREVFPRINEAMTQYLVRHLSLPREDADALRLHYWRRYGATLLGLVRHHGVDPHHFLRETHAFPDLHRIVRRDQRMVAALRRLPGRRILVTNSPLHYARRVVRALGVASQLDAIVPVEAMRFAGRYQPKPSRPMLRRLAARLGVPAARCVLVEDSFENLAAARAVGMSTVLVTGIGHGHRHAAAHAQRPLARRVNLRVRTFSQLPYKQIRRFSLMRRD
jgi:putative hydrolase of the HAD superfamily